MLLGDIIHKLAQESGAEETLVSIGDIMLLATVNAECEKQGETLADYASGSVRRFSNLASDDDWLQLMGKIEGSDNPSATCLSAMLNWSVKRDRAEAAFDVAAQTGSHTCTCGGNGGCHDG